MRDAITIRSRTGTTRSGAPLAKSRAPSEDLSPWFYWMSVADGELPPGAEVQCHMFGDHPCFRFIWGGIWKARTADGEQVFEPGEDGITLYFGPQSRCMPISVTGSYKVITLQMWAGALPALGGPSQADTLDRVMVDGEIVGHGKMTAQIPLEKDHAAWLAALEDELRKYIEKTRPERPNPLGKKFECSCLADPNFTIREFAERESVSVRTVERMAQRDFGLTPRQVIRRARALDMAATLLGVARPEDEPEIRLRYFDQSHLTREMRHFFGMTPRELATGSHPLLRLNIEIRQARRLHMLKALPHENEKPWLERRKHAR